MQGMMIGKREQVFSWLMFVLPAILGFFNFPSQYAITSCVFVCIALLYSQHRLFRKIIFSGPMLIWLTLTLYHYINARYKHVVGVNAVDLLHGLKIYFCLGIICFWASLDFKKTISLLLNAYLLRCFFVITLLVLGGYSGGRLTGAGGSATGLGQMAALTGIYVAYKNVGKKITLKQNVLYCSLPFLIVLLSQSRNSLAMFSIAIAAVFFAYDSWKKGNSYFKFAIFLCFVVLIALVAMPLLENTSVVKRSKAVTENTEGGYFYKNNATNTIFDKIVGDRLVYYVQGWKFFKENPITGIGLWNYKNLTGGRYPLHSEYMVHLCEGGLVAIILWGFFVLYIIKNLLSYDNRVLKSVALLSVVVLLFCGIYAREFFYEMFYPVYGIALSLKNDNSKIVRVK